MERRRRRRWVISGAVLVLGLVALFVPESDPPAPERARRTPFAWSQDALWERLERDFDDASRRGCDAVRGSIDEGIAQLDATLQRLDERAYPASDPVFREFEEQLFSTVARVGACPDQLPLLIERTSRFRALVKAQSRRWDDEDERTRQTLYRALYGSRAAIEELLLQNEGTDIPALLRGVDEPSRTPSVELHGVTLHSGDILLSRGGAPTSALIARGNDYPGNFSHVALLHVSEQGVPTVIESHIETGVGTTTAARYLGDTKLRIAVLRLRADHPAVAGDRMLPHRAATEALRAAGAGHIAYDFAMDVSDPGSLFCSEVASAAYARHDVRLWRGLSSMSGEGLTRWLSRFGVRHFETYAPSDLEYDSQVVVVAEWRDPDALFGDHLDNAIIDAMLEGAERGEDLDYDYARLPLARLAKAYSVVLNAFGGTGPIPEGMTATTGLRVDWLRTRHAAIRARLQPRIEAYRREHDRRPPYWTLVRLAREAKRDVERSP